MCRALTISLPERLMRLLQNSIFSITRHFERSEESL